MSKSKRETEPFGLASAKAHSYCAGHAPTGLEWDSGDICLHNPKQVGAKG